MTNTNDFLHQYAIHIKTIFLVQHNLDKHC